MLHQFLTAHRSELIERCARLVARRTEAQAPDPPLLHGIPIFLDQLIRTLQIEQTPQPQQSIAVSGGVWSGSASEIASSGALHGQELFSRGFTLEQSVRDYGDLCQAVTGLAEELGARIDVNEFRTFNRCLDNAISEAVTGFANAERSMTAAEGMVVLNTRMGSLAHELRNLVLTASLAVRALKSGNVGLSGATGAVLDRCLRALSTLIDRSLAEVRVSANLPPQKTVVSLAEFIGDVAAAAQFDTASRDSPLKVEPVDPALALNVDRDMVSAAVGNLLQNAAKFTQPNTPVTLQAYATADQILIEVHDHCGGLPDGAADRMFLPFTQVGEDRSGMGLGLDICRRSVEANGGTLSVLDRPGVGCTFTIELSRHELT
jgi:signal transduction histidine kinase